MASLQCKPGDIALVIRGDDKDLNNVGKMVTCHALEDPPGMILKFHGRIWRIDRLLTWRYRTTGALFESRYCPDAFLLPIRPRPGPVAGIEEKAQRVFDPLAE